MSRKKEESCYELESPDRAGADSLKCSLGLKQSQGSAYGMDKT